MKRCVCWILAGVLILSLSACGGSQPPAEEDVSAVSEESSVSTEESSASVPTEELPPEKEAHAEAETESSAEHALSAPTGGGNSVEEHQPPAESPESGQTMPSAPEDSSGVSAGTGGAQAPAEEAPQSEESEEEAMNQNTFVVSVGGAAFNAAFAENSGAQALKELLAEGPMTLSMRDYGGFEKVGALGRSLPTSNAQITTQTGDIVLYQGNQIVIFYGSNSWSYTRPGRIADLSGWAEALGSGDVEVTLSLPAL